MGYKRNKETNALIIFVDARGFTSWAGKIENFNFIDSFSEEWYTLLKNTFSKCNIKYLGDGAMITKELEDETSESFLVNLLEKTIKKIDSIEKQFSNLCKNFSITKGSEIPLDLGWGITKGTIKKLDSDYIGAEINKSARYCGIARPFGIVVDAVDFQRLPKKLIPRFFKQKRILKGIDEILDVWVSKEIYTQFLTRENLRQSPEVHIAGICFKKEKDIPYVLLGKRSSERKLYPDLYEGCGGQLASGESFIDGVKRHYELEYRIEVEVFEEEHKFYSIQYPNEPFIQGVIFLCEYKKGEPKSENHEYSKWFSREEFDEISEKEFIPGLKNQLQTFFNIFTKKGI